MDIVFIILHYNAIKATLDLIDSIKSHIDTDKYQIVVVDNGSPNKTGLILKSVFQSDDKVTVLLNNENLGFANGNNVGIEFVRNQFSADYICCLNNDTLLLQSDLLKQLKMEYEKSNAAVIGPLAYLKDGTVQNSAYKLQNIEFYEHLLDNLIKNKEDQQSSSKEWIKNKIPSIYKVFRDLKKNFIYPGLYLRKENRILHGSCLVFTPSFFKVLDGFDNRTFLFREEELLYINLIKHHLKSVYNPKIRIRHLEDVATDTISITLKQKKDFVRKNQIDSLKVLINEMSLI